MTNKQEQTSREAFEEFAEPIVRIDVDDNGLYLDYQARMLWLAWQAATQYADR